MTKAKRAGKVLVDWSQNDRHKTTICVYSLRAKERPTVSTPLEWDELEAACEAGDPDRLVFDHADVLRRSRTGATSLRPCSARSRSCLVEVRAFLIDHQ